MNQRLVVAAIAATGLLMSVGFSAVAQQQPSTQPTVNQPGTQQNQPNTPQEEPVTPREQTPTPRDQAPNTTAPLNRNTTTPLSPANLNAVDRQFMISAAQGGMAEVMLGQLAVQRAVYPETKEYARRMIEDHTRANNELMRIAKAKGVTLPTTVNAQQQALMTRLRQIPGTRFDQVYMNEGGVNAHAQQRALFQREIQQGQDVDVKAFASRILPAVTGHLAMANNMAVALNQGRRPPNMMNSSSNQNQMNQNMRQQGVMER
jgi:putative membrane protein